MSKESTTLAYNSTLQILQHHFFFLSSFSLSSITGAAGMLNHHSRNLLIHLSVLVFLIGEYRVNVSKKINTTTYLLGRKARVKAMTKRAAANFSLA